MDPQYFAGEAAHQNGFTINGATNVGGTAETEKGSLANVYAAPLGMGTSQTTGTTYMAVEGGGTEMVTFATPQTSLSIYWGSIDGTARNLNSFAITIDTYTLIGADLVSMFGAFGTGSQTDPQANQLVTITGLGPFTTATFSSTANAFEFSIGVGFRRARLGNDGPRIRRARVRRVPSEHEGSCVGDLIASPSPNFCEGPPRGGPLFLRCDQ
jgi:hypothetical protein